MKTIYKVMGRTWQIFGTICLPCGKKTENRKKHQRRRSAWVGQADFGKLELNNRNHSGNCQRLLAKRDQFEIIAEIF